jgi:hypothetical protein
LKATARKGRASSAQCVWHSYRNHNETGVDKKTPQGSMQIYQDANRIILQTRFPRWRILLSSRLCFLHLCFGACRCPKVCDGIVAAIGARRRRGCVKVLLCSGGWPVGTSTQVPGAEAEISMVSRSDRRFCRGALRTSPHLFTSPRLASYHPTLCWTMPP